MKTTIEISLRMASEAYDAITDNRNLEERVTNDYPNTWIIEEDDEQEHDQLLIQLVEQLSAFGIPAGEYEITNE
jgi:phage terminase large subunit GpA-like protein